MKRIIRILSVILVLTAVFSCSSCMALDEVKEHHIVSLDESEESLKFKDKIYEKIDTKGCTTKYFAEGHYENYYLTTAEVPVLLSFYEGNAVEYDSDTDMIKNGERFYCPSEEYDNFLKMFNEENLTGLVAITYPYYYDYYYGIYNDDTDYTRNTVYLLSESLTESIYNSVKGEEVDKKLISDDFDGVEENYMLSLCRSSKNGEIIEEEYYVDIYTYADRYYATFDEGESFYEISHERGEELRKIV